MSRIFSFFSSTPETTAPRSVVYRLWSRPVIWAGGGGDIDGMLKKAQLNVIRVSGNNRKGGVCVSQKGEGV